MGLNFPSAPNDGQVYQSFVFQAAAGAWRRIIGTGLQRNRVINPAMQISQQNANAASGTSGYYPADQWRIIGPGTSYQTWERTPLITPRGSPYRLRSTALFDYGNVNTFVAQDIEGTQLIDFCYGAANARCSILRVGINAPAGTYGIGLQGAGNTISIAFPIVVTAANAGLDREYFFPVPAITTGTWIVSAAKSISLTVSYSALASYQSSDPGVWQTDSANKIAPVGISNNGVTGQIFDVFDVGWYLDPYPTGVAPEFQMPLYEDDLAECQRYWYKMYGGRGFQDLTTTARGVAAPHTVSMRTTPSPGLVGSTLRAYDGTAAPNITSVSSWNNTPMFASLNVVVASGMVAGRSGGVLTDAQTANYIAMDARM